MKDKEGYKPPRRSEFICLNLPWQTFSTVLEDLDYDVFILLDITN